MLAEGVMTGTGDVIFEVSSYDSVIVAVAILMLGALRSAHLTKSSCERLRSTTKGSEMAILYIDDSVASDLANVEFVEIFTPYQAMQNLPSVDQPCCAPALVLYNKSRLDQKPHSGINNAHT